MRANVVATQSGSKAAAHEMLAEGAGALDAALAGYFAAAGETPWALFAPVVIAVAGFGARMKFVDGRARQPGKGIVRPLRYAPTETAPAVARIAVPSAMAAVAVALATDASRSLRALASFGVQRAKQEGAKTRAHVLERFGALGMQALQGQWFWDELTQRAPRIDGCLLTEEDLASLQVHVADGSAIQKRNLGMLTAWLPAWNQQEGVIPMLYQPALERDMVLVEDGHGLLAGVLYERAPALFSLFDGELQLPLMAHPVLRSVPWTRPGTPLFSPAPIGFMSKGEDVPMALIGSCRAALSDDALIAAGQVVEPAQGWIEGSREVQDEPHPSFLMVTRADRKAPELLRTQAPRDALCKSA